PEQTTRILRERLNPAQKPPADELRRLIAELDASEFNLREKATQRLTELGDMAEAALQEALRTEPTPEARRRIERLLAAPPLVRDAEVRRHLRAVRILEHVATPEARELLQRLAAGAAEARLTSEAKAALERLGQR